MCTNILPVCTSVNHVHAWCLQRQEDSVESCGTEVTVGYELPCECWKPKFRSPTRLVRALNCQDISPALNFFIVFISFFGGEEGLCVPQCECGHQRTTCIGLFSPYSMWVSRVKLWSSDLPGRVFINWVILLAP